MKELKLKNRQNSTALWIPLSIIPFLLSACLKNESTQSDSSSSVDQKIVEQYIKIKAPGKEVNASTKQRLVKGFIEQNAMANVVVNDASFDATVIDAELQAYRNELLLKRYIEHKLNTEVNDDSIKAFYEQYIARYSKNKAHVAAIIIATNEAMSEEEYQKKQSLADDIYSKLSEGQEFETLAKEYSDDQKSALRGGNMGWISSGRPNDYLLSIAKSIEDQAFSKVSPTAHGFVIVKLLEDIQIEKLPFEAIQDEVRADMQDRLRHGLMQDLKQRAATQIQLDLSALNVALR